jgi:uracil-DNA glycosylase
MARSDPERQRQAPSPATVVQDPKLRLPQLAQVARSCTACPLYRDATQTVFGVGPIDAAMVLVGEQPGDEEDKKGLPFVGPAGKLLDQVLEEAGIKRDDVYVTNAVKHFKFVMQGKRRLHQKPKAAEIRACQPWLDGEIERLRPLVLVALGSTAVTALFGSKVGLQRDRGHPIASPRAQFCYVTYHPSAALRAPTPEDRARIRGQLTDDLRAAASHLRAARRDTQPSRMAIGSKRGASKWLTAKATT